METYNPDFVLLENQNEFFAEENYQVSDTAWELLHGAIDTHVHANPTRDDEFVLDDFELVREYEDAGLDGVVIKCHQFGTFYRSKIAQKYAVKSNKFKVYGSICLNYEVGGLNPVAVEAAIMAGAKIVFLPTMESRNGFQIWDSSIPYPHYATEIAGQPMKTLEGKQGIYLFDEEGNLKPEVYDILELVRDANVTISSGHVCNKEGLALYRAAHDMGVKKMVYQHIDWRTSEMSIAMQREMARLGVKMEKSFYEFDRDRSMRSFMEHAGTKPSDYLMSSDQGMFPALRAARGFACNVQEHLNGGVPAADLKVMLQDVPHFLVEG